MTNLSCFTKKIWLKKTYASPSPIYGYSPAPSPQPYFPYKRSNLELYILFWWMFSSELVKIFVYSVRYLFKYECQTTYEFNSKLRTLVFDRTNAYEVRNSLKYESQTTSWERNSFFVFLDTPLVPSQIVNIRVGDKTYEKIGGKLKFGLLAGNIMHNLVGGRNEIEK